MCKSRTAINQPLTRRGRDVQISDYRVWTGTAKGKDQIPKEKTVSKLSVSLLSIHLLIFITFHVSV
jgi:hypothetical protein